MRIARLRRMVHAERKEDALLLANVLRQGHAGNDAGKGGGQAMNQPRQPATTRRGIRIR